MEDKFMIAERCPACGRQPKKWIEAARFRSSEIFYVACGNDPYLMGQGKSAVIAVFNWKRVVNRWKMDHAYPKVAEWLGGNYENRKLEGL